MRIIRTNEPSKPLSSTEAVSPPYWIKRIQAGETNIPAIVLHDVFRRLALYASRHFYRYFPAYDAEDAAQSALRSFCIGLRNRKFDDLKNSDEVWKTLITITKRKIIDRVHYETRQKRGSGYIFNESTLTENDRLEFEHREGSEVPPDLIVDIADEIDFKLGQLSDQLKKIALWRIEGYSNSEIAQFHNCTERTIERKLALIRKIWQHS